MISTVIDYDKRDRIFTDIAQERNRQDILKARGKFRRTCADPMSEPERLAVLTEELGEVARCVFEGIDGPLDRAHLREELIQVAAVCVAWLEGLEIPERAYVHGRDGCSDIICPMCRPDNQRPDGGSR